MRDSEVRDEVYAIVKLIAPELGGPFMHWGEEYTTLAGAQKRFDDVYRREGEQWFAVVRMVRERLPLHEPVAPSE